jgi:hypothetical protein
MCGRQWCSASQGAQTPWESSSLTGDFIFNPTVTAPPPAAGVSAGFDQRQLELAFGETIKSRTDANVAIAATVLRWSWNSA